MGQRRYAEDYTSAELMAVVASREIRNGEKVFVGIGVPMIAGFLALYTHAPDAVLVFEGGYVGGRPPTACTDVGDSSLGHQAFYITSLWRVFSDLQRGYFDLAIIGAAQIDRYGNVNSTAIFGSGDYQQPDLRLPGSGGANDMASSARRTIIMTRLERRRFVEKLDYLTSPGFLRGGRSRWEAGLLGGGPSAVITDKAVFRFTREGEMFLSEVYPGVSVGEVEGQVGWKLRKAERLRVVEPPTLEEVEFIRSFDPTDVILRGVRLFERMSFKEWVEAVEESLRKVKSKTLNKQRSPEKL
ncbi:MAG: glutaconate CoA-transferase [Candidatus Hecatellales archaeon]|nr:MAG: glutaconate CoA-transferase [Candidatus Hecatellales archaeon]